MDAEHVPDPSQTPRPAECEVARIEGTLAARHVRDWLMQWELQNPGDTNVIHAANGVELRVSDLRKLIDAWWHTDPVNMSM